MTFGFQTLMRGLIRVVRVRASEEGGVGCEDEERATLNHLKALAIRNITSKGRGIGKDV